MRIVTSLLLSLLLVVSMNCTSNAQSAGGDAEATRIIENLKLELPQLRQAQSLTLGPRSASDVPGFQRATLTINGQSRVPVLVREDGQQVLLLAAPPIDVSRSAADVQAAVEAEQAERRAMLAEATAGMPTRGPADAPVTLVEFSDFQCPYCAQSTDLVDQVLARYPERVKFVYLHFPLPNHGWARPAAIAAECARQQAPAAFWTLHDAYFNNQGQVTEANLIDRTAGFLQDTAVDLAAWRTCATDTSSAAHQQAQQAVQQSMQAAQQLGVRGTPTFYIDGEHMQGPRTMAAFGAKIEEAAAQ